MLKINFQKSKKIFLFLMIGLSVIILGSHFKDVHSESYTAEQREVLIRFGITAPLGVSGYDLTSIHALTYLDWAKESSTVPDGVEYIHVLKMRFVKVENDNANGDLDEAAYQQFLTGLPDLVMRNPGSVWLIGNEPDRKEYQDDLTPEKYAERFFEVATIIKSFDSNSKIGFGSVVQPTPIRILYLEKSLARLSELAGDRETALTMIDIWSIHSFILNEVGSWGADIPVGLDCSIGECDDAILITDYSDTYSIDIFMDRILYFRHWLNSIGEREKPLWITEYGSLFYYWEVLCSINNSYDCENPINGWPTEKDTIEFMVDTFNFLLQSNDENLGNPNDGGKLVQRWYWYSLNDHLYSFGGTLFDPDNDRQITELGKAYKRYIEFLIFPKTFLPIIFK